MNILSLHDRAVAHWADAVTRIGPDDWDRPTPCAGWTVRDLVGHVVGEQLWAVPLLQGSTIAEVGDRFAGDVLGGDPLGVARDAAARARAVAAELLPTAGTVHLSYGEETMEEYARQLAADHLVHGWDLAAALGTDRRLDPELVAEVAQWFAEREGLYRSAGLIAGAAASASDDPQEHLLSRFGRDPDWGQTHADFARFVAAFGAGDVDAIMSLMTEDCVFESTGPAPDGVRHESASSVRAVWEELFTQTRDPQFTEEESFVAGDRAVLRWRFTWTNEDGSPGHVRGVDVVRMRQGRVCEKLSYVKG